MIILQYPTELAPAAAIVHHAVAPDILDHHEGKLRGESRRLKLLEHAHQRNAHRPDTGMPKPPKQLCPAEGKKTAVQVAGHLVQIGERHHEGDRLALHFRNAAPILADERLHLLARIGTKSG